jgi:alpha-methylacyl-CoA racemase
VKSLGIDYESVWKVNPQLMYCSCTGYGQTGHYSQKPGRDINYVGVSGVLGIKGRHTGSPIIPVIPIADMTAGVFCALAICAALSGRFKSGEGQ